ncbi:MAG TPA: alpha/beta hydrolase, partial [Phototrophicaceae bacterium]|nr:alpha/beta hydrolase [Phototrophicaceae bacterium]
PNHSFDVIVPSLPGFGFSDQPRQREGVDTIGILVRLMTEVLGYTRFGVQGGDTGSPLAKTMAVRYPQAIVGVHLTDIGYDATFGLDPATLSPAEQVYMAQLEQWSFQDGAYYMIQSTKPQTLAYGLTDSPVGLAAWIMQHFQAWSDCGGDLDSSFTKDELLTNIMIYWVTETLNSSIRWYYAGEAEWEAPTSERVMAPVGVALFPHDLPPGDPPPRELAERSLNVQRWTRMPRGGHFAALETPELLAEDLWAFFGSLGGG